jgi:hypothetical protein
MRYAPSQSEYFYGHRYIIPNLFSVKNTRATTKSIYLKIKVGYVSVMQKA